MATFKAVVRNQKRDGLYPVYIRLSHKKANGFLKTDKVVSAKSLTKDNEIIDPFVVRYCSNLICEYAEKLNRYDISHFTVKELIEILKAPEDVSFSKYATSFINKTINENRDRTAKNYRLAVDNLERFVGTTNVMFSQLSTSVLIEWIESLKKTHRAKEMYPTCIRSIFKKAIYELNDEERGVVKIKYNPWLKIVIPRSDTGEQKAISAEACREFFNRPLPKTKMLSPLAEFARDVALMSLCLGGINTVDLYRLKKGDYRKGIISYNRAKTKGSRRDEAYMEIRVEPFIQSTIDKYLSLDPNDEYLFTFHKRHSNSDSFNANVNIGIRRICADMGMPKGKMYCYYTFRHTWATIAQNDCDANLYDVAFGLNHSHGMNVTRGYVKIDFTPAWELNAKVIDFIFFSNKKSKQGNAHDIEEPQDKYFRISPKMLIKGMAYFKGEIVGEVIDIGFSNIEQVLERLYPQLPDSIPFGSMVQFRLVNRDSMKEVVYERCKGKSF